MKGGRRQGRQKKRWENNIREWTGLEFGKSQRSMENRDKWRKLVLKIICGAPTTLADKGYMIMMMMLMMMMMRRRRRRFLSDTTHCPMVTLKAVCRTTVKQKIQLLYRSRQTLTSPSDIVLRLMRTAHARFLSDTTHCLTMTLISVCRTTVLPSGTEA